MARMLGKKPAVHDPRTLKFAKYANTARLPHVPPAYAWDKKVGSRWGMMMNDQIGCCAIAAPAHMVMQWTANTNGIIVPTDEQVVQEYSAVSGYDPQTGDNDNGCNMLDVLKRWRNVGLFGHKILAFVQINQHNHVECMQAQYLFGGLYIGIMMPEIAQDQVDAGQPWHVGGHPLTGKFAPGGWGGHAVNNARYGAFGLDVCTWGDLQPMAWDFHDAYVDEVFGVVSEDWIDKQHNKAPSGFDLNTLLADLKAL